MKTVGGLILLISVAMIVLVGTIGVNGLLEDAASSNDSTIVTQSAAADNVISPILTIFGFLVLVVGAMIAVNAFR